MTGTVYLVGAGPGDAGLITVRGRDILSRADVVVYDRLIGAELLEFFRDDAEKIFVGKEAGRHSMTQDEINAVIVEKALRGKDVCRLKGGDPFVFGRGGEEALFCLQHDVPFQIVPGVTSSIAAPAYAGIPVTHRGVATSFAVVTGHTKDDDAPPENLPVADTLVCLMGVRALPKIVAALLGRGESKEKPVALVRWGTTENQQVVTGTLATIESEVEKAQLKPPALIVIGDVVNLREQMRWFDIRPLWGKTVIVTRAREQASSLVSGLRDKGARVIQCPTIRVEMLDDYSILDGALSTLQSFDWIVFTSTNGVEHFWARLENRGLDARALGASQIAAIGPATVEALKNRGLRADFVPESSISESVAEGLNSRGVSGQKILIVRALEGREVLQEKLAAAGAEVVVAPCYQTVPDHSQAELARQEIEGGRVDWVTFTSSSTVQNFVDALGADFVRAQRQKFRVACIGPITAQTAERLGLTPDAVAQNATVEALLSVVGEVDNQGS
jgi:uroporphyrinogen III methyltransferase / synthase